MPLGMLCGREGKRRSPARWLRASLLQAGITSKVFRLHDCSYAKFALSAGIPLLVRNAEVCHLN